MGLFSSKTYTYVSSTIYSLAGDEDLRPNLLRSTVLNSILSGGSESIGEAIQKTHINAQYTKHGQFFRWAKDNYVFGVPAARLTQKKEVSEEVVKPALEALLPLDANQSIRVDLATVDDADMTYWAEYWVAKNRPELTEDDWSADYDWTAQEIVIEILDEDPVRLPAPDDLLWGLENQGGNLILYVSYVVVTDVVGVVHESAPEMFTYRIGSGNADLDALGSQEIDGGEFFPPIPLRLNNVPISHANYQDKFPNIEKACKKLANLDVNALLDSLDESESIGDIDYAFLIPGVPINAKSKEALHYMFEFFKELMSNQLTNKQAFVHYARSQGDFAHKYRQWHRWMNSTQSPFHPANGGLPPNSYLRGPSPAATTLRIQCPGLPSFDFRLSWMYIDESIHIGNGKTFDGNTTRGKMKAGEYWIARGPDIQVKQYYSKVVRNSDGEDTVSAKRTLTYQRIYLFHQYEPYRYKRLEIVGLQLKNYVYAGHSVSSLAANDLNVEQDETGFLLPLHYPTLKKMGLIQGTQLASENIHMVLNSYIQKKVKWYQRGFFKFVLIVGTVGISIFTGGAGAGLIAGSGVLGGNLAIGFALGAVTVSTAALVGAAVNAIAGVILVSVISKASGKIFGEEIGAIIGAAVTFIAFNFGSEFLATGSFNVDWSKMLRIDNLMKVTQSVSKAYSHWLQVDTQEMLAEATRLQEAYGDKLEELNELSESVLGMTSGEIDPMMFTDLSDTDTTVFETSESFLNRTLLTGSDLAELSLALIENFAEISLELPNQLT